MKEMSFVGLHNTNFGIIGFADSKSTIVFSDGHLGEDENRKRIRKVFKNKNFICVNYGNNELFSNKTRIEDYFEKYMDEKCFKDFFDELYLKMINDVPDYNDGKYQFLIGSKDIKGYFILSLTFDIRKKKILYSQPNYEKIAHYAGEEKYVKMYNILKKYNNLPLSEYANDIKRQIELMIDIFDIERKYNSVGKPVCIEMYQ